MKSYFGRRRRMQLSALLVGGLLYGSAASAAAVAADEAADLHQADSEADSSLALDAGMPFGSVARHISLMSYRGGYSLLSPSPGGGQTTTEFTASITNDAAHDAPYTAAGVRKGDGNYVFTKDTKINRKGTDPISGGIYVPEIAPAISNSNPAQPLNIDLGGKKLTISGTGKLRTTVGIAAIGKGSKVHVKNAGAISITEKGTQGYYAPTLFVNGGGSIHIENGGENLADKVLTLRSVGKKEASIAVIKALNNVNGAESNITIDGLVDLLADGTYPDGLGANEGVSAVASRVDIGGGTIRATGDAWAAIRAYGEMNSENYGTVNFNVTKGADGLANGAGKNRAVLEGDIVTNGGMGTKGRVSVGLSTADSHWIGSYTDAHGYGMYEGVKDGEVRLFMKNGSYWKGFSDGRMRVEMSGAGTHWTGFNMDDDFTLMLKDGAIWHNAVTPEQKNYKGEAAISRVKNFTGDGGFIDMTGKNRFLGTSKNLSGSFVRTGSSTMEDKGLGETGDLQIENYSGNTKVLYRHDAASPTTVYGGKLTIAKAAADSAVTLTTDNAGLNTESTKAADKNLVSATLDALAKKLYYTAYTTGEKNLTGKAEIAEGLTTSAAMKRLENITFNEATGQGSYVYTPATDEQTKTEFTTRILGTAADQEYINANVRLSDGTYRFSKDASITSQNDVGETGAIRPSADVHIDAEGKVLTVKSGSKTADVEEDAAIANDEGKAIDIKAKTLKILVNNETSAAPLNYAWGIRTGGGTMKVSGMTEIEVGGVKESKAIEATSGKVTLEGLSAKTNDAAEDVAALCAQGEGHIEVNVKDSNANSGKVMLNGSIAAKGAASRVDAALKGGESYFNGFAFGEGTINLWLQNGAVWKNQQHGAALPTGFAGSRLTRLVGGSDAAHAGAIFQKHDKDITINNYSGHTRVFYEHDATMPTTILGGKLTIAKAAADSAITLTTDNAGLNTESQKAADKNLVSATLDALAKKLYYTAYTTGEKNLTGKAEIAEGLTTSAAMKRLENITFNDATGQGSYVYTPAVDPAPGTDPGTQPGTQPGTDPGTQPGTDPGTQPGTQPEQPGTQPEQPGTQPGTQPEQPGTQPGTQPEQPGTQPGTQPEQPGTQPEQPGTQPGTQPEQPGTQPGTQPEQPGTQPGTQPEQSGTQPEQPGTQPEQPGTQPGTQPEQPGTQPGTQPQQPEQQKPEQPQQPEQQKPAQPQQPGQQKPAQPQQPEQQKPEQPQQPEQQKPEQKSTEQKRKEEQHKIEYGDYETKLMSGVKSAMTASTMAWRAEANDLMKRMGDLRFSPEDEGVWARVYRGKSSSNKDKTNFDMNYTTIQVGYDKKASEDWRVGVAGSYMKGTSSYASGSGKNKEGNLGIYGTWTGKSGEYVDLIAKIGKLTNEYTVYNNFGHYVKGDFHTWGGSLSAEYGRRISLKGGSFVEPQIELIYSHLNGSDYTGKTDYVGQSMHVRQGAMNSFVSRLGVGFGQETERGTWFLKASLYHEFAGDLSTDYSNGFTPKSTTQRGKDTWVGIQFGGTAKLNDRTSLYGTFEKTFGGDIKTDWRVDAGLRWSF